jgi:hypothetical protein
MGCKVGIYYFLTETVATAVVEAMENRGLVDEILKGWVSRRFSLSAREVE